MHSRTIDTPPAEMRKLVPKLSREIEELERLRAEAAAAIAAVDEAERAVQDAEQADRQALADRARGKRKQEPKPSAPKAREALAQAETSRRTGAGRGRCADRSRERRSRSTATSTRRSSTTRASRPGSAAGRRHEAGRTRSRSGATLALRRWLDDGRYSPGKSRSPSVDLRKPSGEQYRVDEFLPLIEGAFAPPVERPKPEPRPLLTGHAVISTPPAAKRTSSGVPSLALDIDAIAVAL